MRVAADGRERTPAELAALLRRATLKLKKVHPPIESARLSTM
jgi:hypothetical protein